MNLAARDIDLKRFDTAREHAESALPILEEVGDEWGRAAALGNLSTALLAMGYPNEATRRVANAIEIMKSQQDHGNALKFTVVLGAIDLTEGRFQQAIETFKGALARAEQIQAHEPWAAALAGLGTAYLRLGLYDQAEYFAKEVIRLGQRVFNERQLTWGWEILRNISVATNNIERAVECQDTLFGLALRIKDSSLQVAALLGKGYLLLAVNDLAGAEQCIEAGQRLADAVDGSPIQFQVLLETGCLSAARGNVETALAHFTYAYEMARDAHLLPEEAQALWHKGAFLRQRGRFAEAEKILREAVAIKKRISSLLSEDVFKISHNDLIRTSYCALVDVLAAQNKVEEVVIASEESRARAFSDLLERRLGRTPDSSPTIGLAEIQRFAQQTRTTIVSYFLMVRPKQLFQMWADYGELFISVVCPDGRVELHRVGLDGFLANLGSNQRDARQYPSTVMRKLIPSGRAGIHALDLQYQLLIEPIRHLLPQDQEETVVFIPDGFLFTTPFPALRDRNETFLIKRHTVMTAPSIQVLLQVRRRRESREANHSGALVVGNPDGSLPFAEHEARAVSEMLKVDPLIGPAATKQRVLEQARACRIIHLATHGVLADFPGSTMPGAVVMAPVRGQPCLLGSDELMDLEMNADLVVLSACSTACGCVTADGVSGLSRALLAAGASSALVTLWDVPDESTKELMLMFYEEYLPAGDKAQALRRAMLATMARYPAPSIWAAFALVGER